MDSNSFVQKVRSVDWMKYLASEYYDPERMFFDPSRPIQALVKLCQFDSEDNAFASGLSSEILFAIGNDHRGTYYPAALEAIDLIIEFEKYSDNEKARNFAKDILNDLYYFKLEMSFENKVLYDSIDNEIREKLKPYSDENVEND